MEVERVAADAWRAGMTEKSTLEDYRRWKTELVMEQYLEKEDGRFDRARVQGKRLLTRFRGGATGLRVDTGRWQMYRTQSGWKALPRHRRKCPLCFSAVEDHRHVLCDCPA